MLKNSPYLQCNWSFRRFWAYCADELGSARLQVDTNASKLEDFCGNQQFALSSLKEVLRASYKRSRCKNLDSRINLDATLDVLGEAAFMLQGQSKDDLLDIELLEEVGWCITTLYSKRNDDVPEQAGRAFYDEETKDLGTSTTSLRPIGVDHDRHIPKNNLVSERACVNRDDKTATKHKNRVVSLERAKQRRANSQP